jgi:hypothetical protein
MARQERNGVVLPAVVAAGVTTAAIIGACGIMDRGRGPKPDTLPPGTATPGPDRTTRPPRTPGRTLPPSPTRRAPETSRPVRTSSPTRRTENPYCATHTNKDRPVAVGSGVQWVSATREKPSVIVVSDTTPGGGDSRSLRVRQPNGQWTTITGADYGAPNAGIVLLVTANTPVNTDNEGFWTRQCVVLPGRNSTEAGREEARSRTKDIVDETGHVLAVRFVNGKPEVRVANPSSPYDVWALPPTPRG